MGLIFGRGRQFFCIFLAFRHDPKSKHLGSTRSLLARILGEQSPLRKFLGSKEHLDSFKIYLNAAKIITVQGFKNVQRKKPVPVLYGKRTCLCTFWCYFTSNSYLIDWSRGYFFPKLGIDPKSMPHFAMILPKFSHGKLGIPGALV